MSDRARIDAAVVAAAIAHYREVTRHADRRVWAASAIIAFLRSYHDSSRAQASAHSKSVVEIEGALRTADVLGYIIAELEGGK
jgi:hypothetical protein